METELRHDEIERLVSFERKFGKEGLTFDDVLLLPAEYARPPERRLHDRDSRLLSR